MEKVGERPREQDVQDVAGETVEQRDLKIAVCILPTGSWETESAECVANMVSCFQQARYDFGRHEARVFTAKGPLTPEARHRQVARAATWGATHILFLDADITVPWDTIQVLLRHDHPVVAANLGTACMLVNLSVLDKLEHPFFLYERDPESPLTTIGEDPYFMGRLRAAGFRVHVDGDLAMMVHRWAKTAHKLPPDPNA